ncbi:cupin domain-containing protein [Haloarcula sp. GH36]|uniref:cupin domain-containing protein n=1 Tax=Haloarcula montana TaxID=3111776 RepID=UPI002D795905|nr:cupin domain-containing protein [Haloarcula sp. GH36]
MSDESDSNSRSDLTPRSLDYTHLPDQTMYKVSLDDASCVQQGGEDIRTYPVCVTNEFKQLYFEMEPGATIDWHTHTPSFDEFCLCLAGKARYTLAQEDGTEQIIEVQPREFVYLPGGARHTIEAIGDERHEGLVTMPPEPVGRMELLEGAAPYDPDDWPIALWVDRKRDELVRKDAAAVSE